MPVVKAARADGMLRNAIVLDLGDLQREGKRIIERARAEADRLLAAARDEASGLAAEAGERGYAEGHARGLEEGLREGRETGHAAALEAGSEALRTIEARWQAGLESFESSRADLLRAFREDVIALALAVADKLVYRIVEVDPSVVEDQLAEALSLVARPTSVIVQSHPEDRALLEAALPELVERFRHCEHVSVHDDPQIERGGCVVETAGGTIDARIRTQLNRIVDAMLPRPHPLLDNEMSTGGEDDRGEDRSPDSNA